MAGQEDQDDGDEDDRQTLLSAVALALAPSAGEWGGNKARWFQFYFDPFKIRPEGFIRDCQIYPDVEVDEDKPGQNNGDQQLHVLLVDLVVEDVVGELPVHAHVGRDLQELGQVEGEAEHEDGRQVDHQPPPAPHPRVQRVADPAVTLNTARGRCNLVDC